MRPVALGGVKLWMESPEAPRYLAPILIVPGVFQSNVCWRGMTSMLAHRGWEVYLLPRSPGETTSDGHIADDQDWSEAVAGVTAATGQLGDDVILFGADIGASMVLAALGTIAPPLALALFAPATPAHVGAAFSKGLGFFGARRLRRTTGAVAPAATLAATAYQPSDIAEEPRSLVNTLTVGASFTAPNQHPPSIVFVPHGTDPLVAAEHARGFAQSAYAKTAPSELHGRWWPSLDWEHACDEAHRFLILTLGDRVVEFPEEIIDG